MEYCRINLCCMSWQTRNISWLIVAIFCHSPASDMLEFNFHVLFMYMCSLLYLLNMCSLLKCKYLFCNYSLSFFVILRLQLHVCIMLTFMFCEINDIWYINIQNVFEWFVLAYAAKEITPIHRTNRSFYTSVLTLFIVCRMLAVHAFRINL